MGLVADRFWIGGTVTLISFIAFSSQLFVIYPSYGSTVSNELLWLLVPFNLIVGYIFWNYTLCITTDPGRVPKEWAPSTRENDIGEVKKLTGSPRFCRTCKVYKPPRAHHCRKCDRCIPKMDHHCPWVSNCVGFANYGHFVRFLIGVDVGCAYHLWMISTRAFGALAFHREPSGIEITILILNYTACVPTLLMVGMFSLYHIYCMLSNTTTIEGWEKDKVHSLKRRGKIRDFKYPYHLGYYANIQAVLGTNPLFWMVPKQIQGDGFKFAVGVGIAVDDQYAWPPRDEFAARQAAVQRKKNDALRNRQPFTYGHDALNPDLTPSSSSNMRQRFIPRTNVSPFHPDYEPDGNSSDLDETILCLPVKPRNFDQSTEEDEDDDDVPLGIAMRRARAKGNADLLLPQIEAQDPLPVVRLRHGSEGYEVRPIAVEQRSDSDHSWDQFEDEDGDPVRRGDVGDRYRRYEAVSDDSMDSDSSH